MSTDKSANREKTLKEAAAGTKAARKLRSDLRREAASRFRKKTGALSKISASKRMRGGSLRAIAVKAPKHAYILHHGFIGTKSNGVFQRLEASNFLLEAIGAGSIDTLASEIAEIRAEEIVTNVNFL